MRNVHDRLAAAVIRAIAELTGLAGLAIILTEACSQPWASITFAGARHRLAITLHSGSATALRAALERLLPGLPEAEIPLAGEIVADLTVEIEALGEKDAGSFVDLRIEALTVRD